MAFASLSSNPPNPVLHKNMTDSELAGDEREDGELEDGEIDDEGIGIEEEGKEIQEEEDKKEKQRDRDDKSHRHSRKRYRKVREKRRSKKRRRDRQKNHSPSSSDSSDSYDSDHERSERPKSKKKQGSYREYDSRFSQHSQSGGGHGKLLRPASHKNSDYDKYSDYSEDRYDYEGEDDDFADDGGHYRQGKESTTHSKGGPSKEPMKRPNMKGVQKQQYLGPKGRGRGGPGRGRGMMNKNKKQKGKSWGRGRGRGADQTGDGMKEDGKGPPPFQKKRPIMTQEFINQHTVEHNGRYICKYFLEGRCIKGDQCKFEHDLVVPDKKKELCKFYIQGYCSKGDNCIYMHSEYPCKFFHTGAKCFQGDKCKFSHEPLTDVARELLEKVLNIEGEALNEDEQEVEELRKQGIAPLPKPPPGVGLLPTPGPSSPSDGKKIPSLFEIVVQPTVDLAQKIAQSRPNFYNSSPPPDGQFQGTGPPPQFGGGPEDAQGSNLMPPAPNGPPVLPPESPGSMGTPPLPHGVVPPLPQNPPGQPPPHTFLHGPPMNPPPPLGQPPAFHGNLHSNRPPQPNQQAPMFPPPPDLPIPQNMPFPAIPPNAAEFFSGFFSSQAMGPGDGGPQDPLSTGCSKEAQQGAVAADGVVQVPDFLPAVQKALFLRLSQKQPEGEGTPGDEGKGPRTGNRDKDDATNWYSSDDEDGNSMTAILRSLKKQNEAMKPQQPPTMHQAMPPAGLCDPRLHKDRAPPTDPRKADPRQRAADIRKGVESTSDPRLVRDPRKMRPPEPSATKPDGGHHLHSHPHPPHPMPSHRPRSAEDDDEGEREPREKAVLIPLEPRPGVALKDPRCQVKQFSHIRVDILLSRPAFAHTVVWAPEDLIPSLIPKQEPSINLPLPPLIADARLNRSLSGPPPIEPTSPTPTLDPRLAAARLKGGFTGRSLELKHPTEKPLDPRISRSASLDSKLPALREASHGGALDPKLLRASTGGTSAPTTPLKAEPERLPPYAPRLSSSGGVLESPTALLGGISLYDPRNQSPALPPAEDGSEAPKKPGILKQTSAKMPPSLAHTGGTVSEGPMGPVQGGHSRLPQPPSAPTSPLPAPAVHNLPIQALAGLIRPPYADSRQAKPPAQSAALQEEEEDAAEEPDDRPLKDVFKTFDPTASPFCQ